MASSQAIVSVWDKTGVADFCRVLAKCGYNIISSGGTAKALTDAGIAVTEVSDYTGFPEMFGGRVKTLHPKIAGGILYDRKRDAKEAKQQKIEPIDIVVVNFYPFEQVAAKGAGIGELIENIDIGGPSMVRAAAKNFQHVAVIVRPEDYAKVASELEKTGKISEKTRFELAKKAFERIAHYDAIISDALSNIEQKDEFPDKITLRFEKAYPLRYGENPHQKAAAYRIAGRVSIFDARIFSGKQMSYNNFLDADSALSLILEFPSDTPACAIIKHNNPCGGATAPTLQEAYVNARATDPIAAYGSIIAFNQKLDAKTAAAMGDKFIEVILAPGYEPEALEVLKRRPSRRILDVSDLFAVANMRRVNFRTITGGMLYQDEDREVYDEIAAKAVSRRTPCKDEMASMHFAMKFAKHTKSNAVIIARGTQLIGVGAGQMSRIDSTRIAIKKATDNGFDTKGAVCASDAFLPFPDVLEKLADAGIIALAQPGGSKNDAEVIKAADARGVSMIFTGLRHFRH
jgi:phosphoribosylaminoimidazolecarboxamide formyltransferase/IMP cyclohydrolase